MDRPHVMLAKRVKNYHRKREGNCLSKVDLYNVLEKDPLTKRVENSLLLEYPQQMTEEHKH